MGLGAGAERLIHSGNLVYPFGENTSQGHRGEILYLQ